MNESQYLQIKLIEECAEVIQRVCKALCFGLNEIQEGQPLNNTERLEYELNDLFCILEELKARKVITNVPDIDMVEAKKVKLAKYMQYSKDLGIYSDNV